MTFPFLPTTQTLSGLQIKPQDISFSETIDPAMFLRFV